MTVQGSPAPARPDPAHPDRANTALLGTAVALVAMQVVVAVLVVRGKWEPSLAAETLAGIPYLFACALVLSGRAAPGLALVVGVGVVLRLIVLPLDPFFSTDVFRYVWEGRIQAAGFSPYLHVPADPVLEPLRDAVWAHVNRADYAPTIYPPVAQAFFFLVTRISETVTVMKAALVGCEAVAVWAIVRLLARLGLPRRNVILYLWCPMPAWEFAGNGHIDALMLALVALALLASHARRDGLAGLTLGAAIMVKFVPVALSPALWRRWDLRFPLVLVLAVVVPYVPHVIVAGTKVAGFLGGYAHEEGIESGLAFWPMRLLAVAGLTPPLWSYFALVLVAGAGLALAAAFAAPREPRPAIGYALALATVAMIALSPAFPWYFTFILIILCLRPYWPLLWLMATSPLLYMDYGRSEPRIVAIVYGGTVLLCAAEAIRLRLGASGRVAP